MKMSSAFAANGCDVTLIAKTGEPTAEPFEHYLVDRQFDIEFAKEPNIRTLGRIIFGWRAARRFKSLGIKADLLYGRDLGSLFIAANTNVPFAFELHHIHPGRIGRYLIRKLSVRENCRGIVAISDALKQDLVRSFPSLRPENVLVASDAADDPLDKNGRLCEYRDGELPRIGYIGHLYPGKGMELISVLAEQMRDFSFEIIGGAQTDIDSWRERLSLHNVTFHGFVPHGQLSSKFQMLDICLLPNQRRIARVGGSGDISKWTSPLKLFEYMAYGMPIVASDVPVLREVLTDRVNAILVAPENVDGWVAAIKELAADANLRANIGRRARKDFLAEYTWRSRAGKVLGMISR